MDDTAEKQAALLARIDRVWENGLTDPAALLKVGEECLREAEEMGFVRGTGLARRNIAYYYFVDAVYPRALEMAEQASGELRGLDVKGEGTALDIAALVYRFIGMYDRAMEFTLRAVELFRRCEYHRGIAWSEHNLGLICFDIGDVEPAIEHFEKALKAFEELDHKIGIARVLGRMAGLYSKRNEFEKSLELHRRTLAYLTGEESQFGLMSAHMQIAQTFSRMGRHEDALHELTMCEHLAKDLNNQEYLALAAMEFAEVHLLTGNIDEAGEHIARAAVPREGAGAHVTEARYQRVLSEIEFARGNHAAAYLALKKYNSTQELINSEESRKKIHYLQTRREVELAEKEREFQRTLAAQTEALLLNILPDEIMRELRRTGKVKPVHYESATVLFTDFAGFTALSAVIPAEELLQLLNECFSAFDTILREHGVEKLKTIGDGYLAVAGVPARSDSHARRCVSAALEIREYIRKWKQARAKTGKQAWDIRIGMHSGPLVAGVIGDWKYAYDIWGDTVNTASRVESNGRLNEVNISADTRALVGDYFQCEGRGTVQARGKGALEIFTVRAPI